jgi:heat shock protein HslJ
MKNKSIIKLTLLALTALAVIGLVAACAPPNLDETAANTPADETGQTTEQPAASQKDTTMPAIEDVVWELESYVDADGNTQPALADAPATLIFSGGKFIGDTHCNSIAGTYKLDGDKISTQMGPSTLRACKPDIASQEGGMIFGVSHAASYKIEDGKLMLMDADGNVLLTFKEQPAPELTGSSWQLISFNNGKGGMESNQATANIHFTFGDDGTLSGNAGCNDFNGSYTVDGETLTVGPLATTRKMCSEPEGVMDTEQAFLNDLGNAAKFTIFGGTLTIFDKDGGKLLIAKPAETLSITSTPWRLQSFNNGKGGMVTSVATDIVTAVFTEDGKVMGNAGCNDYNGSYEIDGNTITISPLASTRKMCSEPPDVMETENLFLQNMTNAKTFTIENKMLTLFDGEGTKLLVFFPAQ